MSDSPRSILSSSPLSSPRSLRQELIERGACFLMHPTIAYSSLADKVTFLEQKGLSQREIMHALHRAEKLMRHRERSALRHVVQAQPMTVIAQNIATAKTPSTAADSSTSAIRRIMHFASSLLATRNPIQAVPNGSPQKSQSGVLRKADKELSEKVRELRHKLEAELKPPIPHWKEESKCID